MEPVGEAGVKVNSMLAIGESHFLFHYEADGRGRENDAGKKASKVNRGGSNVPLGGGFGRGE
jgi:hypothetical protein